VTGLEFAADRVTRVRTRDGTFHAPAVVNCAGPWGAGVAAMAGLRAPIRSARIQVAVFERPVAYRQAHPVVLDFAHASYFRPETGGLMLVGRIDPEEADDVVEPDLCPGHADYAFIADVGERWIRRCPPMEESRPRNGYSGLYAVTPDWHPIVDETPAGSGFYQCTGFSGHGFKLAPAVGVMTADMVTAQPDPEFDWRPFSLSRFTEGKQIRGTYEYSITG
jgi:sarcosine oxidase subunit beta